ncbi:hypothetical protein FRB91_007925 [Serendipita sp. 411]|nr:hypothetical protein FRB91_007925 [Serendipita sp. 411]
MLPWKCEPGWETPEGSVSDADSGLLITREESTFYSSLTKSWQKMPDLFSQSSLAERDKLFIRHTSWKPKSIIWLLNQISISPDVYQRILTPINELSTIVEDSDSSIHNSIPWTKIFQALADRYISFLWNDDLTETAVIDYALQIQCLNSPSLKAIIDEELGNDTGGSWIRNKDSIQILRYWIMSFPLKASRSTIEQIVSDQLLVRDLVRSISSSRLEFCKTWISLFSPDEKTTCMRLLPKLLDELSSSPHDKLQQRLDAILYIICTGRIPWDRTVDIDRESWGTISLPATPLTRRLQAVNWINKLDEHEHGLKLVRELYHLQEIHLDIWPVLYGLRATDDEIAELVKISPSGTAALIEERKKVGPVLRTALSTFDRMLNGMEDDDKEVEQCGFIVGLFYTTLIKPDITPGITSLDDWTIESLNKLQNPCLQVLASVAVGISWNDDWSSGLGNWSGVETPIMSRYPAWERVSELCLWDPPFLDTGDIWGLRLRLWNHLPPLASREYLSNVIIGLDTLMDFERGLSSSNIGIKEAGDFILAVIHLHLAYGWTSNTLPNAYESLIPDLLVGDTTNLPDDTYISTQCIEHLSSICRDISTNPVRLICILVELVRADINFHPKSRQPGILFKLLKYAKAQLSSKELLLNYAKAHLSPRELPLFVSLWKRLVRYIDESSKQFSEVWENMTDEEMPHQFNRVKNKDLQTICDEVIDILTPAESWVEETEQFSGSWPPWCLRPTGTITNLLDEDLGDDNDIGHVIPTDTIPLLDEQSLAAII